MNLGDLISGHEEDLGKGEHSARAFLGELGRFRIDSFGPGEAREIAGAAGVGEGYVERMLRDLEGRGVLMRGTADSLDGMARLLAGLSFPFVVRKSPELGEALGRHASELARLAGDLVMTFGGEWRDLVWARRPPSPVSFWESPPAVCCRRGPRARSP